MELLTGATIGLSCDCKATIYAPITASATIAETVIAKSSLTNADLIRIVFLLEGFLLYV